MIADAKHNGNGSGTTSMRYEKISAAKTVAPPVETELTEEALLRHHGASALAAMRELFAKIQGDAKHAADPREWAERYPWASVAAAAAAGFAAAATIAPHKKPAETGDVAATWAADRARYEAYLRDVAERPEAASPPPRPSAWTPLVEMAKSAAARYLMSAAQAGIAAFAATHAATAATDAKTEADDQADGSDARPDIRPI